MLPLLLFVVLAAILFSRFNSPQNSVARGSDPAFAPSESGETVSVEIDFGDGSFRRYSPIPWSDGMTVADVMEMVAQHRHGVSYQFDVDGTGKLAMLHTIERISNEGEGSEARNWVYEVNRERVPKSFAVCQLEPSDAVLWKFAVYRYNEDDSPVESPAESSPDASKPMAE